MPIMPDRPAVYLPLKIRSAYNLLKVKKEYISLCISETNLGISSREGLLGTPYVIQNFQTQKKDCFYPFNICIIFPAQNAFLLLAL